MYIAIGFIIGFVVAAVIFVPIINKERKCFNQRLAHEHNNHMRVLDNLINDD